MCASVVIFKKNASWKAKFQKHSKIPEETDFQLTNNSEQSVGRVF